MIPEQRKEAWIEAIETTILEYENNTHKFKKNKCAYCKVINAIKNGCQGCIMYNAKIELHCYDFRTFGNDQTKVLKNVDPMDYHVIFRIKFHKRLLKRVIRAKPERLTPEYLKKYPMFKNYNQ